MLILEHGEQSSEWFYEVSLMVPFILIDETLPSKILIFSLQYEGEYKWKK